jgi:hypothetical protein
LSFRKGRLINYVNKSSFPYSTLPTMSAFANSLAAHLISELELSQSQKKVAAAIESFAGGKASAEPKEKRTRTKAEIDESKNLALSEVVTIIEQYGKNHASKNPTGAIGGAPLARKDVFDKIMAIKRKDGKAGFARNVSTSVATELLITQEPTKCLLEAKQVLDKLKIKYEVVETREDATKVKIVRASESEATSSDSEPEPPAKDDKSKAKKGKDTKDDKSKTAKTKDDKKSDAKKDDKKSDAKKDDKKPAKDDKSKGKDAKKEDAKPAPAKGKDAKKDAKKDDKKPAKDDASAKSKGITERNKFGNHLLKVDGKLTNVVMMELPIGAEGAKVPVAIGIQDEKSKLKGLDSVAMFEDEQAEAVKADRNRVLNTAILDALEKNDKKTFAALSAWIKQQNADDEDESDDGDDEGDEDDEDEDSDAGSDSASTEADSSN